MIRFKPRTLLQHVRCPECGVPMLDRVGKKGEFYGCSRFPICVGTRPKGDGYADSYTALLRVAYTKAVRFLSSPKFMGYATASRWVLSQAVGHEVDDAEYEDNMLQKMAVEHLEKGVDAAGEWASEKAGDFIDFLLNAHEDRYSSIRARLRFVTTPEQLRAMPKPEIVRRYDTGDLSQFEAHIATAWRVDGIPCPQCGGWCEPNKEQKQEERVVTLEELFEESVNPIRSRFECGRCGFFERVEVGRDEVTYEYDNDKNNPLYVKGVAFKAWKPDEDK